MADKSYEETIDEVNAWANMALGLVKTTKDIVDTTQEIFDDDSGKKIEKYAGQVKGPPYYLGDLLEHGSRRHGLVNDEDWAIIAELDPWTGLSAPSGTPVAQLSKADQRRFFANSIVLSLAGSYRNPTAYRALYDQQMQIQDRMGWCKAGSKGCDPAQAVEGVLPDGTALKTDLFDYRDAIDRLGNQMKVVAPVGYDPDSPETEAEKGAEPEEMSTGVKVAIGVGIGVAVVGLGVALFRKK